MRFFIFQTGEPLPCDSQGLRPMRAINLAEELTSRGHYVEIWSSSFFHQMKHHRFNKYKRIDISSLLKIHLVASSGYTNNIGIARFVDHIHLAFNLWRRLRRVSQLPDAVVVGYPPIEWAWVALYWAKRWRIFSVIDIKDQWPHSFLSPLSPPMKIAGRILLTPYYLLGRASIRYASAISTVSIGYVGWINSFANERQKKMTVINPLVSREPLRDLGCRSSKHDYGDFTRKENFIVKIIFFGSMTRAFNFIPILKAAEKLMFFQPQVRFILCGDGDGLKQLEYLSSGLSNVELLGWVDKEELFRIGADASLALAPYRNIENFNENVPNKISDYLSLGLPIATSLSGEVGDLVTSQNVGFVYDEEIEDDFFIKLKSFIDRRSDWQMFSDNAFRLYRERFDGVAVYRQFCNFLETKCIK